MNERESTPAQRTFGRGLVEGLKIAGIENPGDVMNNVRMKSMEAGLNGAFRKVYEVIPISGVIGLPDIMRALRERGQSIDHGIAKAGIGELLEKGLIRSVSDKYQRIAPKPVVVKDAPERSIDPPDTKELKGLEPERPCNPIERMSLIEAQLKGVVETVQKIAKDVADTAIDAEMFVERIKNDNSKVQQLKELLKSL